ncbi:hypothetical protein LRR18_17060, partial [Mangrovimonas sp. AS39]|uniref:hypothetical protein n=1 Tax=Mangrovimonas futianensis TaxID=2895523 RepID=UPI001E455C71
MTDTVDPCNIDPFRDFCTGTVKYPDPKGRKTVLLVDADILLYQLTSEATVEQYEGNNEYTYRLNMETVKANFESRHREMARDFDA